MSSHLQANVDNYVQGLQDHVFGIAIVFHEISSNTTIRNLLFFVYFTQLIYYILLYIQMTYIWPAMQNLLFGKENNSQSQSDYLLFIIFVTIAYSLIRCFKFMADSYQYAADNFRIHLKMEEPKRPHDHGTAYAGFIWLIMFAIVQLFEQIAINFFWKDEITHYGLFHFCFGLLKIFAFFSNSLLNSFYAFDPCWIASNLDTDDRFDILSTSTLYFLGFGLPITTIGFISGYIGGFFYGYGSFLIYFPLTIFIASTLLKKRSKTSLSSSSFNYNSTTSYFPIYIDMSRKFARILCRKKS